MSLVPPALRAVDHQAPPRQGHPGQAAGQDLDLLAVEDERPQVDVPALEVAVDERRVLAQRDRRLGDVAARVGLDLARELLALRGRGGRADQHAVAPRAVDRLDHQLVQVGQDVLPVRRHQRAEGLDVGQDRVLVQVVADDLGDERVDPLVVGHAGADGVGQPEVPRPVGADQPGDAELAVAAERSAGRGSRRRSGGRSRRPASARGSSA